MWQFHNFTIKNVSDENYFLKAYIYIQIYIYTYIYIYIYIYIYDAFCQRKQKEVNLKSAKEDKNEGQFGIHSFDEVFYENGSNRSIQILQKNWSDFWIY